MASYSRQGIPNEYVPFLHVNTHPDSDSDDSKSSNEEANVNPNWRGVAYDALERPSEDQRGLINRHNFLVNNYNSVRSHNKSELHIWSKRMSRFIPFGGQRVDRHRPWRSRESLENTLAMLVVWGLIGLPVLAMITVPYSHRFPLAFSMVYLLVTVLFLNFGAYYNIMRNTQIFFDCPYMVPVAVTSRWLEGFCNSYIDLTTRQLEELKVVGREDLSLMLNHMKTNALPGETARLMFYSPEYTHRYIELPRQRILYMIVFSGFTAAIGLISFCMKDEDSYF